MHIYNYVVNALNTLVNTTERSGNMKELKQTIYETVSTLRKLFINLIETNKIYVI
jgi:hypothetical protein